VATRETRTDSTSNRQPGENKCGVEAGVAYNEHVREFAEDGRVPAAAEEARRAVDSPEGPSLRDAEKAGKARIQLPLGDRVRGLWTRVERAARAALDELRR